MDGLTPRPFKCTSCDRAFTRQTTRDATGISLVTNVKLGLLGDSDLRKRHVENCHVSSKVPAAAVPAVAPTMVLPNANSEAWFDLLAASAGPADILGGPYESMQQTVPVPTPGEQRPGTFILSDPCIDAFLTGFLPNFPLLHEGSFHVVSAQVPLLNVIRCIGSLYCQTAEHDESWRKATFQSTLQSLRNYVEQNRSRHQETWVLQTFLLLEYLGLYGGDDWHFLQAQRIHRDLVDAIRMLQMTHTGSDEMNDAGSAMDASIGDEDWEVNDADSLEARWQEFVKYESRKRCIYILYLLDSQLSILCNVRPMLSSLEIKHDLPCCEDVWLAKSAEEWSTCQKRQFRSFDDHDDQAYSYETPPSQGLFYEASQTLLQQPQQSEKGEQQQPQKQKQPRKLRLLWASPFAAVILVMQLQMMARELTHASCLLERPKAQRRSLSVLTDKQHAQISQALRAIAELVPRNQKPVFSLFDFHRMDAFPDSGSSAPLWHSFWLLWYYTSITLSHPDSLLVSGIVESNLPLAIATAGHLATPRSKEKRDIYEDRDVFRILNDLELALEILNPTKSTTHPSLESPFTSLLGFKICLVGWRLVRLTMIEACSSSSHNTKHRSARSRPCAFVLDAIMSGIGNQLDSEMQPPREIARSEVGFLEWVVATLKTRTTWPVGKWVAAVMEENVQKAVEAYGVSGLDK
ncbi:fungal-specific transcription factor domain-containing protein [Pseudomassariella vexata]|uniref:Fungal-specific transcription factor domain-domain-containing protein n=1 Tax=Pseudomassariella vexata TaxID=1141098 RepID=A0A1Y2DGP8_9PEZI|nr:fungal-specific transcription factor domain-containing protein [Pseudomassariella vexata]ORY58453.1 fungal-specific transcription factor domain-domain-containing protein [Pseudomassariella vexata]